MKVIAVKRGHRAVTEAFLDHDITGNNREESLQQCDKNRERIDELNLKLISAAMSRDGPGEGGGGHQHWNAPECHAGSPGCVTHSAHPGLDVNIRGLGQMTGQMTALMFAAAAQKGHTCLQTLLDHGALTDIKNKDVDTARPLYEAEYDHPDIAGELLVREADVNIINNDKIPALQLAEERQKSRFCLDSESWD